jgi:hypothetical protein
MPAYFWMLVEYRKVGEVFSSCRPRSEAMRMPRLDRLVWELGIDTWAFDIPFTEAEKIFGIGKDGQSVNMNEISRIL